MLLLSAPGQPATAAEPTRHDLDTGNSLLVCVLNSCPFYLHAEVFVGNKWLKCCHSCLNADPATGHIAMCRFGWI